VLRRGDERRGKGTSQRGLQEAAAVHAGVVGRMRAKVNYVPFALTSANPILAQVKPPAAKPEKPASTTEPLDDSGSFAV
jgi:hypothetical protein